MSLLGLCPCFVAAAVEANLLPGFVGALRKLQAMSGVEANIRFSDGSTEPLVAPALTCLSRILGSDTDGAKGLWKHAVDAGIVPLLIRLLACRDELTARSLAALVSEHILRPARISGENIGSWACDLDRAMCRVLRANEVITPISLFGARLSFLLT